MIRSSRTAIGAFALATILALLGSTLPSIAIAAEAPTSLDGAHFPEIAVSAEKASLVGLADAQDPVFTVAAGGAARSRLTVDASGLPAGSHVADTHLDIVSIDAPSGGTASATTDMDPVAVWGISEAESRTLNIGPDGADLKWTFSAPGDYGIRLRGTVTYTTAELVTETFVLEETLYRFRVDTPPSASDEQTDARPGTEAGTKDGTVAETEHQTSTPDQLNGTTPEVPSAASSSGSARAKANTVRVVKAGAIRLSNQWDAGQLRLSTLR